MALCTHAVTEPLGKCLKIENPTERLACYDKMLESSVTESPTASPMSDLPSVSTKTPTEKTKIAATHLTGALREELPRRKTDQRFEREDDVTRYTVSRILRKYGGKVEYLTENGRRFRKISTSHQNFQVGDVLVAKRGVFEAVFLVNEEGKRIKVKIMD